VFAVDSTPADFTAERQKQIPISDHLSRLQLRLPRIQEQRRIAKILDAADLELSQLRRKLDALKLQKRGLMQQLLTGTHRFTPKLIRKLSHD